MILTWEFRRCGTPADENHPYWWSEDIAGWFENNATGAVFLARYSRTTSTFIETVDLTVPFRPILPTSYEFIRGASDSRVEFMQLEFENDYDLTLFKLAWSDRVKFIDEIPFAKNLVNSYG